MKEAQVIPSDTAVDELSTRPAPASVIDWFRERAYPIRTTLPHGDEGDLGWLSDVVGEARIVSLGEASHGTSEYFTLKHRFVRHLVERHGFTEFSIEANFAGGRVVDAWVQGEGPDTFEAANIALAHTSYHTWDTVEVLDMIRWMRAHNAGRPETERVHFHGFDIGGSALAVVQYLEYLDSVDPSAREARVAAFRPMTRGTLGADRAPLVTELDQAIEDLDANRARYVEASSAREFAMTRLGLADARRALAYIPTGAAGESMTQRDQAMADNCAGLLEAAGEGRKLIVWAHNAHVARQTMEVPANPMARPPEGEAEHEPPETATVRTQGWHLADRFGADQRVIGFALGGGHVKMWDLYGNRTLRDFEFGPPPDDTVDAALARLGEPLIAVDLRNPPAEGEVAGWLRSPRRSRSVTAGWFSEMSEFFTGRDWLESFDAIVYVEKSTGVTYNPTVATSLDEASGQGQSTEPASEPVNLDLAAGTHGWVLQGVSARPGSYRVSVDGDVLQIERRADGFRTGRGAATQHLDAAAYRGQRVSWRAEVRAEADGLTAGAYLLLSDGAAAAASDDAPSDWAARDVSIVVGPDATRLTFAVCLQGNGAASFRSLSFESE